MIKINVLTIFPELYEVLTKETIIAKAIQKGELTINIINIRDYTNNKHKKVDDYPYGGGEGMLLMIQPIDESIKVNNLTETKKIYTSPKGKTLNQEILNNLATEEEITILVGRYEGVDQRVFEKYDFEELSIGDFILTGGDLVAQIIIDGISRLLPNVLNNSKSAQNDTFTKKLLEHPQYTRPFDYEGYQVPEILLSGHHEKIEQWKLEQEIAETKEKRYDIYEKYLKEKNEE